MKRYARVERLAVQRTRIHSKLVRLAGPCAVCGQQIAAPQALFSAAVMRHIQRNPGCSQQLAADFIAETADEAAPDRIPDWVIEEAGDE